MTQPTTKRLATESFVLTQMAPGGALAEVIRDTIGTALTGGTNITITVNDAGDLITVAVSGLTKSSVGLANVDNTSDVNKPVSTAQQTALDTKDNAVYAKRTVTAAYTLVLADGINIVLHSTAATAVTITVPTNATVAFPDETRIPWRQYGAGTITFAGAAGVTVNGKGGALRSSAQFAAGVLTKVGTNLWVVSGDTIV